MRNRVGFDGDPYAPEGPKWWSQERVVAKAIGGRVTQTMSRSPRLAKWSAYFLVSSAHPWTGECSPVVSRSICERINEQEPVDHC